MDNVTQPIRNEQALQAEHAVIGSLLIDAAGIAPALFASVKPEDFQTLENREIFAAALRLFRNGQPIDGVTVRGSLLSAPRESTSDENTLSAYMAQLMEITPTSANWREYAAIMKDQSRLAKIRRLGGSLVLAQCLDDCRPIVAELSDALANQSGVKVYSGEYLLESFLDYLERVHENPEACVEYISYGLPALDEGIFTELGDVVVIGGYPSDGKTTWAINLAWRMAQKWRVGFFSLETSKEKMRDRFISHSLPFDFNRIKRIRTNMLNTDEWGEVWDNVIVFSRKGEGAKKARDNFNVIEAAGMSATDIQAVSRAWGFQIIFIDYIQEVSPDTVRRYGTRNDELAAISRSMHVFAQSTKTTVFELSQLNRSQTGNPKKRDPHLDSLRESGQLEQDADAVFLLYRENPGELNAQRILRIAKNKEGCLGLFYLDFDPSTQTFTLSDKKRNVAGDYSAAGRAAKQSNRVNAYYENQSSMFDEDENSDLPF